MTTTTSNPQLDQQGGDLLGWVYFSLFSILLCGLLYPALGVLGGGLLFPQQAQGSLIEVNGKLVGSTHASQGFAAAHYLIGRPSAAGNDPRAVAGSNLAPSNPALREAVQTRSAEIVARDQVDAMAIPVELVSASGGGIDPHISPAAAELQVKRIAAARGISVDQVRAVIAANSEGREWGVFGQPRVHVLRTNLALDAQHPIP